MKKKVEYQNRIKYVNRKIVFFEDVMYHLTVKLPYLAPIFSVIPYPTNHLLGEI